MTTPKASLCYIDPDWEIEVQRPSAANGRQYVIEIDGVALLIKEDIFHRFLRDFRDHLEGALSDAELAFASADIERTIHVPEVRS